MKKWDPEEIPNEFEFPSVRCCFCNGYYGPSFEEPLCVTCHMFIFPDDLNEQNHVVSALSGKTDDGDSGNDEPSDPGQPIFVPNPDRRGSFLLDNRAKGRALERADMLSNSREQDQSAPVLIESLPPEV